MSGLLFSLAKAESVRKELIEKDGLVKLVASYERTTNLQDLSFKLSQEQLSILQTQNTALMKQVTFTEYQRYMWLGLGIVGTSLAVYGAGSLRK